jgi:hypothetical protein
MICVALTRPSASTVRRATTRPLRIPSRAASGGNDGTVRLATRSGVTTEGDGAGADFPSAASSTRSPLAGPALPAGAGALLLAGRSLGCAFAGAGSATERVSGASFCTAGCAGTGGGSAVDGAVATGAAAAGAAGRGPGTVSRAAWAAPRDAVSGSRDAGAVSRCVAAGSLRAGVAPCRAVCAGCAGDWGGVVLDASRAGTDGRGRPFSSIPAICRSTESLLRSTPAKGSACGALGAAGGADGAGGASRTRTGAS